MSYDLEISSTEWLLHVVEIINMRKREYKEYIEARKKEDFESIQRRYSAHLEWWHTEGKPLSDFDEEIAAIIHEVDSRGEL